MSSTLGRSLPPSCARLSWGALVVVLVVVGLLAGCPRPLAEAPEGPSQVAPDAVAVLRLPRIDRAERAARLYLAGTRGSERSELEALLAFAVQGQATGSALLGLDEQEALLVSWRPSGEALVWLPIGDPKLFDLALDRLLEARGATRDDDVLGGVRVYRDDDGTVSLLARATPTGALLWPVPADPFAAAALIDALARGAIPGRWPTSTGAAPPRSDAAADLYAEEAGVVALAPSLAALFGGPTAVPRAQGRLVVTEGAVRLELALSLDDAARARLTAQVRDAGEAPPGFCALEDEALAVARLPVALLRADDEDDGPLDELKGQLAVALLPREGARPGWIAAGRPAGLAAREELLAGVLAAGVVERRQETVGGRAVRVLAPPGVEGEQTALRVIADEDLFVLAFAADEAVARLASGAAPCDRDDEDGGAASLSLRPAALERALAGAATTGEDGALALGEGAIASLRRLSARLPGGFSRVEVTASLAPEGVVLHVEGALTADTAGE